MASSHRGIKELSVYSINNTGVTILTGVVALNLVEMR